MPIVSSIVYLVVGIAMFYIWPVVQSGIAALGALVLASGYAGTFIYGLLERARSPLDCIMCSICRSGRQNWAAP